MFYSKEIPKKESGFELVGFKSITNNTISILCSSNLSAIKTYLSLLLYCDFNTGKTFVSMDTIVKRNKISKKTLVKGIRSLEDLGLIRVEKAKNPATGNECNIYYLNGLISVKREVICS